MVNLVTKISQVVARSAWTDKMAKLKEYRTRTCRYPDSMLGRTNFLPTSVHPGGVLVVAAHPDDDILGVGATLIRHAAAGEHITVAFTTNGAGGDPKKSMDAQRTIVQMRYEETCSALDLIHIPSSQIINLGFPDGGAHRYVFPLVTDFRQLLETVDPSRIYVHSMEGGHPDHDITSFAVQQVCHEAGFSALFEWAEYNRECPLGTSQIHFPHDPYLGASNFTRIEMTAEEAQLKKAMLDIHRSQRDVIPAVPSRNSEVIREANPTNLAARLQYFIKLPRRRAVNVLQHLQY